MADRISISNVALARLGEDRRLTDAADPVKAARLIAQVWDQCRDKVLRSANWNFARERFLLPALANVDASSIWPFTSAYQLPTGYLRFVEILEPEHLGRRDWKNEGGRILTRRTGPIRVACIMPRPNIQDWDALAADALAGEIAEAIAVALTGDEQMKVAARQEKQQSIVDARGTNSIEGPGIEEEDDDWILARFR